MPNIHLLESETPSNVGGVLLTFESGHALQARWSGVGKSNDPVQVGKQIAAEALRNLNEKGLRDDLNSTNWPSLVAGIAEQFRLWRERQEERTPT